MRKIVKNTILTLLLLTLSISTGFLVYLHFFTSDEKTVSGEWTANLDLTEGAAVAAFVWLQDIEAVSVSLEDVESYMQELTVSVNMNLEQITSSGGNFQCKILPESYDTCRQAAYEAFAVIFQDLLARRLQMAGYEGSTDQETIEAFVTETFGMSTVSYLMTCGPELLPSLEALQAEYDGSGTYEAAEGILTRQYNTGQGSTAKVEYYVRTEYNLILTEESDSGDNGFFAGDCALIYTLTQSQ